MKLALVTGASSGIGREFARQLAAQGYRVLAVARREQRLQELMEQLPGDGHSYLLADLAEVAGRESVMARIAGEHVHLLVNNAGLSSLEPFYQSDLEKQRNLLAVDCQAVVDLAHAFLRQAEPGDALINVASIVSFLPTPAQPIYSGSKAFLAAFSECLWHEQRGRGIYVMGLCPGLTRTEFVAQASAGAGDNDSLPAAVTQDVEEVVAEALVALARRKEAIVVTGRANRLMLLLPRLLPRHRLIRLLAVIGDPERALDKGSR